MEPPFMVAVSVVIASMRWRRGTDGRRQRRRRGLRDDLRGGGDADRDVHLPDRKQVGGAEEAHRQQDDERDGVGDRHEVLAVHVVGEGASPEQGGYLDDQLDGADEAELDGRAGRLEQPLGGDEDAHPAGRRPWRVPSPSGSGSRGRRRRTRAAGSAPPSSSISTWSVWSLRQLSALSLAASSRSLLHAPHDCCQQAGLEGSRQSSRHEPVLPDERGEELLELLHRSFLNRCPVVAQATSLLGLDPCGPVDLRAHPAILVGGLLEAE